MNPNPQQMPQPQAMTSQPEVSTAYSVSLAAKRTPFARAKYGLGGYTPPSTPQQSGQVAQFSPSGNSVQVPRLQPLQFGSK